jgi:RNA-directed DNA polymerase
MKANEPIKRCAPETRYDNWQTINWDKVNKRVKLLQQRIVKATKQGRYNKVKTLQWLLVHSFDAKLLAVKRVTENTGGYTAGIDGELWYPSKKLEAAKSLTRKGYKAKPLKRVYIPKKNGKKRPLGIPTIYDRAMQALYLLALDPVSEATADKCSYGFRPKRGCADAIARCFVTQAGRNRAEWILEGDIKGCFNHISHEWILQNIPVDKKVLKQWLKAGFIDKKKIFPTEEGTPQGGVISPTLANMVLDGLAKTLDDEFNIKTYKGLRHHNKYKINLVRYADDFIVTGKDREVLENRVKPIIENFLSERGLQLSQEKTHITHISDGYNFLGQNLRKYTDNGIMLIKPSKESFKSIKTKIKKVINNNKAASAANLIMLLNPIIRGWCNYHKHVVSTATFRKLDKYIWLNIWKWAVRRHPNKGRKWIVKKYFKSTYYSKWVFYGRISSKKSKDVHLVKAFKTYIVRHVLIKGNANPYDPNWEQYFTQREKFKKELKTSLSIRASKLQVAG